MANRQPNSGPNGAPNPNQGAGRSTRPNRPNRYYEPQPITPLEAMGGDRLFQMVRADLRTAYDDPALKLDEESKDISVERDIDDILAPFDAPASGYGNAVDNILEAAQLRNRDPLHNLSRGTIEGMDGIDEQQPGARRLYNMVQGALLNGDPTWNPDRDEALFIEGMNWAALAAKTEFADNITGDNAEQKKAERRTKTVLDNENFYEPGEYLPAQRAAIAELELGIIAARDGVTDQHGNIIDPDEYNFHEDRRLTLEDYLHFHATGQPARRDPQAANRYMETVEDLHAKGVSNLTHADHLRLANHTRALEDQIDQDRSLAMFDDEVKEVMRKHLNEKETQKAVDDLKHKIDKLEADLGKRYMKQERRGYSSMGDDVDRSAYDKAVQDLLLLEARIKGREQFNKGEKLEENKLFTDKLLAQEDKRAEKTAEASQGTGWRKALNFISHREMKDGKRGKGKWYPITKLGNIGLKTATVGAVMMGATPFGFIPAVVLVGAAVGAQAYTWGTARSGRMRFRNTTGGHADHHKVEHAVEHVPGSRRDKIKAGQAEMAKSAKEFTAKERKKRLRRNVGAIATAASFGTFFPVYATITVKDAPKPGNKNNGGH